MTAAAVGAAPVPEGYTRFEMGGPFMAANGPMYCRGSGAQAVLGLLVEQRHVNPMGNLHGGMMASFCDMLLPFAAFHQNEALRGHFLPTVSLQIDYLAAATLGCWLEGRAELLRATRTLVFLQGLVTADGQPCARASAVLKVGPAMQGVFPT